MKPFSQSVLFSVLFSAFICTSAVAEGIEGSKTLSTGALSIMASPVLSLEGKPLDASGALGLGGAFIVTGLVQGSAETVTLTVKSVATGSQYLIKGSVKATQSASVAVGTGIRFVAESTGYAVIAAGQLLAFIPNTIGQALLHQEQIK